MLIWLPGTEIRIRHTYPSLFGATAEESIGVVQVSEKDARRIEKVALGCILPPLGVATKPNELAKNKLGKRR